MSRFAWGYERSHGRDAGSRQGQLEAGGCSPRHALKAEIAGLPYEQQVARLRPPVPLTAYAATATAAPAVQLTAEEGDASQQAPSVVESSVADAFMANPDAYCEGLPPEDMGWVAERAATIDELVAAAEWERQRMQGDEADLSVFEPVAAYILETLRSYPPSIEALLDDTNDCVDAPNPSIPGQRVPMNDIEYALCAERLDVLYGLKVSNMPSVLTAIRNQLHPDTINILADAAAWDAVRDPGLGVFLDRIGVPQSDRPLHLYDLSLVGGVNAGVDTGTPLVSAGVQGQVAQYEVSYRGPRGAWTVTMFCGAVGGQGGASASAVDLPFSGNIMLAGTLSSEESIIYYPADSFTGLELYSEVALGGQAAGGVVSTETRIVSFVNGITFRVQPDPQTFGAPGNVGTDNLGAQVSGSGSTGACFGDLRGRLGPQPIADIQIDRGAGAWLPFYQTTIGFETGNADLDEGDTEAIVLTLRELVSEEMSTLQDASGLDFRIDVVGFASGRYEGAGSRIEADELNLLLSQDRAETVWAHLAFLFDRNRDLFSVDSMGIPRWGEGASWAESELGDEYLEDNDERYRRAEIIVWVQVCGGSSSSAEHAR